MFSVRTETERCKDSGEIRDEIECLLSANSGIADCMFTNLKFQEQNEEAKTRMGNKKQKSRTQEISPLGAPWFH